MKKINEYIEHTILKPDASKKDIEKVIQEALEHNFFGICINPNYIKFAKPLLENSTTRLVSVVNFPLANSTIDTTLLQAGRALIDGADEIDTVINLAELKNKNYEKVTKDLKRTKEICGKYILKVIIETDLLTKEEIEIACKCAIEAGVDCVKTSTGFVKTGVGAQIKDVKLMYDIVSPHGLFVKASGGIKDYSKARALIEAGAARLGTSSGVEIIMGENK